MGAGRHAPIAGEDHAYVIAALLENPEPHDRKICPLVGPAGGGRRSGHRPLQQPLVIHLKQYERDPSIPARKLRLARPGSVGRPGSGQDGMRSTALR